MIDPDSLPDLLKASEVAALFRVSRTRPYHWLWEGLLEGHRVGKKAVRITKESVLKRLQEVYP